MEKLFHQTVDAWINREGELDNKTWGLPSQRFAKKCTDVTEQMRRNYEDITKVGVGEG